ncbi:hypothetical protein DPMN_169557 [Dreissena polymorpha]|uniref:Uncharacterized protein n=1 Tax=Dreissena polymorpha TaxID=45954 RepID=A0A9D4DXL6_DREPO|nr:hypothetical protein DPMN_169557 [Dreissena polymorpha]
MGSCLRRIGFERTPYDPGIMGSCLRSMGLDGTPVESMSVFCGVPHLKTLIFLHMDCMSLTLLLTGCLTLCLLSFRV